MRRLAAVAGAIVMMLALGGWAVSTVELSEERSTTRASAPAALSQTTLETLSTTSTSAQGTSTTHTLVTPEPANAPARLDDSAGLPAIERRPSPVGLTIGSLNVDGAPVKAAGVLANGEMEIPAPTEVGWYRYGPTPGAEGSAVLAAHIAASGVDGVFRHLDVVEVGAEIVVSFDDGTTSTWIVTERAQYDKDSLPVDELFARSGSPQLTLVTCGGAFNPSVRSYEDNVIVIAVPA